MTDDQPIENQPPSPGKYSRRALLLSVSGVAVASGLIGGVAGSATRTVLETGPAPLAPLAPLLKSHSGGPVVVTDNGLVGDGKTDNAPALNALISAVPAGTTLVFTLGTYLVKNAIKLRSGVALAGPGLGGATIKLDDGAGAPFVLGSSISDISIAGLSFDGGKQSVPGISVQLDSCSRVEVSRCYFTNMSHAVRVYTSKNSGSSFISVAACRFSSIAEFAVRVEESSSFVSILQNVVEDVSKGAAPSPAAFYINGTDVRVEGNVVLASADTGVLVAGDSTARVSVVANNLTTDLVSIFYGAGATDGLVSGNVISSNEDFGIHLFSRDEPISDTIVTGNRILTAGKSGIQVEGVSRLSIVGNSIKNVGTSNTSQTQWRCGISFNTTDAGPATDYSVVGNTISVTGQASTMYYGILVMSTGSNVHIAANVVSGSQTQNYKVSPDLIAPFHVETDTGVITSFT